MLKNDVQPDPAKAEKFKESLGFLDQILDGQLWTAGSHLTIADFAIVSTIATAEVRADFLKIFFLG